eukprot:SAG11_NODE_9663_length_891_cov_1.137626_2_plen_73_part_00
MTNALALLSAALLFAPATDAGANRLARVVDYNIIINIILLAVIIIYYNRHVCRGLLSRLCADRFRAMVPALD